MVETPKKKTPYQIYLLWTFVGMGCYTFYRDFIASHRYANFDAATADLIPAFLGLIIESIFVSAIIYGLCGLKKESKNDASSGSAESKELK